MYVCLCRNVTDKDIRQLVQSDGVTTMRELRAHLGVSTQCGKCASCAKEVLQEAVSELRDAQRHCIPILSAAA